MAKKTRFSLLILTTILFSCKSDVFMHRQYRSGFYHDALLTKKIPELKNENQATGEQRVSEIKPGSKFNSINKPITASFLDVSYLKKATLKDSIIISRKRGGRHIRQVFQNNNDFDILVIKREGRKDIIRKERAERLKFIYEYKLLVIIGLITSIIPIIGLILSLHSLNSKKELLKIGETKLVDESRKRLTASLVISLTLNILIVLLVIFLIFAFVTSVVVI